MTSAEYARSLNEVEALGVVGSTAASADEALTGRFWNGPIQNCWNEIAQSVALDRHLTITESARLFALLDITIADGVIAFYDAKYAYARWRPVTAIRAADSDGNAATAADAGWLPEVGITPADPTYPGAHSVISAAGAAVLTSFLGRDRFDLVVTSEVLPGVTRSFASLSAAAEEAGLSRIFAGVHVRDDHTAGARLGRDVAEFVAAHFLRPPGRGRRLAAKNRGTRLPALVAAAISPAAVANSPNTHGRRLPRARGSRGLRPREALHCVSRGVRTASHIPHRSKEQQHGHWTGFRASVRRLRDALGPLGRLPAK